MHFFTSQKKDVCGIDLMMKPLSQPCSYHPFNRLGLLLAHKLKCLVALCTWYLVSILQGLESDIWGRGEIAWSMYVCDQRLKSLRMAWNIRKSRRTVSTWGKISPFSANAFFVWDAVQEILGKNAVTKGVSGVRGNSTGALSVVREVTNPFRVEGMVQSEVFGCSVHDFRTISILADVDSVGHFPTFQIF